MTTLTVPSPHSLPRVTPVRRIVLHAMAEYVRTDQWVRHCTHLLDSLGVSAHAIVLPDGRLLACVSAERIAHHAKGHNSDSVGIEFALAGVWDYAGFLERIRTPWVTDAALETGVTWVADQCRRAGLGLAAVTTHARLDPDRKQDPGAGFPWDEFAMQLTRALEQAA
jgi:N-acetyl-anhydromuramyl-L-alanine amidase AmpD